MKRRSARPFMVEVKQTRTARASLDAAQPRIRSDKNLWQDHLWQDLVADDAKPAPQPEMQAAPAPAREPDAPVRRVLPSLVPMFEIPAEPVAEADPVPRVRRPRGRPARASVAPAASAAVDTPLAQATAKPVAPPQPVAGPTPIDPPGADQAPPARLAWRRPGELRLGERWKRRLPHFMR